MKEFELPKQGVAECLLIDDKDLWPDDNRVDLLCSEAKNRPYRRQSTLFISQPK